MRLKPTVLNLFQFLYAFLMGQALIRLNVPIVCFTAALYILTFSCQTHMENMEAHRGAEIEWAD